MYVCLCAGVSDREIRKLVRDGACTPAEVMRCTRAGMCCGTCRPTIAAIVEEAAMEGGSRRHLSMQSDAA
jgi:bacterioferritin-associated ferredoxin